MYIPEHFRESRSDILYAFVARHPLATLVANTAQGLTANHIPLMWHALGDGSQVLRGHIARANSLWRLVENGASVLAIFTGADHYVSPSWYPSKREDGKAVPTWNYAAVHLRGHIRFIDDAGWLRAMVEALTNEHEKQDDPQHWRVSDAPASYIDAMLRAIVGFEIEVTGIEGKFKGSQNRSFADRAGVAGNLRTADLPAWAVTELVPGIEP